jgi:hypothetical protein
VADRRITLTVIAVSIALLAGCASQVAAPPEVEEREPQRLRVTITLHGTTRSVDTEATVEKTGEEVSVTGAFAIDQSRFGIAPFSILGGAIAIQDRVNINFRIHAHRAEQPARQPGEFM